jgi:hypothetical protein
MTDIRLSDEDWGKMRAFLRQVLRAYVGAMNTPAAASSRR